MHDFEYEAPLSLDAAVSLLAENNGTARPLAGGTDLIDHVRTQLPYALLVGIVAIGLGTLPAGFGAPWWLCLPIGAAVLLTVLRFVGQPVETKKVA